MKWNILLVFLVAISATESAKILGVFPMSVHSHYTVGFTLLKELADRGHEVTMINTFPQKSPIKNFRDVDISSVIEPFVKSEYNSIGTGWSTC